MDVWVKHNRWDLAVFNEVGNFFKRSIEFFHKISYMQCYHPVYRLIEISEDVSGDYFAKIQIINKNKMFSVKPEEILANDDLVNCFSPCDIRALTYLGYLGVNKPKYKILAKRLSQEADKIIFSIKKKGEKSVIVKTADEIINQMNVLKDFDAEDSHAIGYVAASESVSNEKNEMQKVLQEVDDKKLM